DFSSVDNEACSLGPLREGNSQDLLCTEAQDLAGNSFPLTPETSFSANLIYDWEMLSLNWMATTSYLYTDEQYTSLFNNDDYDLLDSYDRWDARLSAGSTDLTWEVTAYVKNISDDREVFFKGRPSTINDTTGYDLTAPRTYGLRLTYNF
ncbi:MAG: hypothetical protein HOH70_04020, partial [Halieaceae bacterium]|nr:hypothetical protein [Halieaceae bacterium]